MMKITILWILGITLFTVSYVCTADAQSNSPQEVADLTYLQKKEILWNSNPVIHLELQQVSLEEALLAIAQQAKTGLYYDADLLPDKTVSIESEGKPLNLVLNEVLNGTHLEAYASGRNILLREKVAVDSHVDVPMVIDRAIQETVRGQVTDSQTGEALPGVNIILQGTTTGTSTNTDGEFELTVPSLDQVLVVSYIGYQTQDISIEGRTDIEITLIPEALTGEELVVIGFGTQRRGTITGSVASTTGEGIVRAQTPNVITSMTGQLPGAIINVRSGEPGRDEPELFIRGLGTTGDTSPLIIIDGVERTTSDLNNLNPEDIQDVSVLKDATAAIYGARAANGVLLVTTKRGEIGTPTFNFSFNQGFSQPTRNVRMSNSYTWAQIFNEIEVMEGREPRYSADELERFNRGEEYGYRTFDWYDYMTKTVTPQYRANLSVAGGSDVWNYFFSAGHISQDGHFIDGITENNRYNIRSNISANVSDNLSVNLNLDGRFNHGFYPAQEQSQQIYSHLYLYLPYWEPNWTGTDRPTPKRDANDVRNWVDDSGGVWDQEERTINAILNAEWDIPWVEGLSMRGAANYNTIHTFDKRWRTPFTVWYEDSETGELFEDLAGNSPSRARLDEVFGQAERLILNSQIDYINTFGNHNLELMAGAEQMRYNTNFLEAFREDFPSSALPQMFAGSQDKQRQGNTGSADNTARLNYFGRATYDYDFKYLAQVIFRYDGSPNFPSTQRWGFFPSISLGWRISDESFMENVDFLDDLKIRGSYGRMGNDQIPPFQYLTSYEYANNYVLGGGDVLGLVQDGAPNPNISWEVANTFNIGLDGSLWDALLDFEIDYFTEKRTNILTTRNVLIPDYTGLILPDENIGEVENKGVELRLRHRNLVNDFYYNISGSFSFARNEVIFTDEPPRAELYQEATGKPIGTGLFYQAIGIWESQAEIDANPSMAGARPGDIRYKDVNGDGVINQFDMVRSSLTPTPEIIYSLNVSMEYSNFDLSLLLQGQENAEIYLGSYFPVMSHNLGNVPAWRSKDRWSPANTNATQPRGSVETFNNNSEPSTHWIFDAGFLRLKNVELGYSLPLDIVNQFGIRNLRIYTSVHNAAILYDSLKDVGMDPETTEFWYYPQQRVFNFGVNISF